MKTDRQPCHPNRIDRFLSGELPQAETAALEQHLDQCDTCDSELNRRTAEPEFWCDTQSFLSSIDQPSDIAEVDIAEVESVSDLENQLSKLLGPTDDPNMLGRFGGYEISGVIGRGGMGIVMKGLDTSLNRFVAIKVLNSRFAGTSAGRQRFAREAQAAAAIVHENVIAIHGVDQYDGTFYLVMPYIKGESLQQRIDRTAPLSLENTMEISLQIARGLAAAHDQGLVHRDIKPANILIPGSVSRILITDFGLARAADDVSLTCSGVISGTPQYMSPEQAKGEPIDGRSDLFSLGSLMYAMVCGHPPFRAETPYGVLRRITDHPHRKLSQVQSSTPPWLDSIIDRLLQKNPDQRFESSHQLAETLEDCLAHVRQPTVIDLPKINRQTQPRWRWHTAIGAALCLAIVIAAVWSQDKSDNPNQNPPTTSSDDTVSTHENRPIDWKYDATNLDQLEKDIAQLLHDTQQPFYESNP